MRIARAACALAKLPMHKRVQLARKLAHLMSLSGALGPVRSELFGISVVRIFRGGSRRAETADHAATLAYAAAAG